MILSHFHFTHILKERRGDSPYSLIIDETTDVEKHKVLVVRYIDLTKGKVSCTYLGMDTVINGNTDVWIDGINKLVRKKALIHKFV